MEKRKFDKLNIESSVLGFGCMRFPVDENGNMRYTQADGTQIVADKELGIFFEKG